MQEEKTYILALDSGTTSCRSILFDHDGNMVSVSQEEFPQIYPKPGWVEHDAEEIWAKQSMTAHMAIDKAGVRFDQIAAIGITNQRETTIVWDKETGHPICPAIVWQCRRTAEYCDELTEKGYKDMIREKTGLVIDAYFSGTKIRWILENVEGAREKAQKGQLLFGTVETWLIWKLSGGKVHVTDYSNASRTMLFNIRTLDWDDDLLALLDIPRSMLPKPVPSSGIMGETDPYVFGAAIPIAGAAGDQQSALFGQTCFEKGEAKSTYGTGGFLLVNTGEEPVFTDSGLVTTVAWGIDGHVNYALEGSVFVAGAVVQWLRDEMQLVTDAAESEELALKVEDTNGCYLVPAFTGLGAPYWNPYARGTIVGITRGVNRNHIVRAALEAIAYQIHDVLETMQKDAGFDMKTLYVDGGASHNNFLMQMQSNISQMMVARPANVETTAKGAAYLAGLAVGFWQSYDDVKKGNTVDRVFTPAWSVGERDKNLHLWRKAVASSMDWARGEE